MNPLERIVNYAYVGIFPNTIAALCTYQSADRVADAVAEGMCSTLWQPVFLRS
jgi:hypothetical protein